MTQQQIQQAVSIYSTLGLSTVPDQAAAVMGDCKPLDIPFMSLTDVLRLYAIYPAIFVCPAYNTVSAFGRQGWKVRVGIPLYIFGLTPVSRGSLLFHRDFTLWTYPMNSPRRFLLACVENLYTSPVFYFRSFIIPPTFNNSVFIKAFQQSLLSMALSLDPNIHFDPDNITPSWPSWSQNQTTMLFNKTIDDKPVIETFLTDGESLKRCV